MKCKHFEKLIIDYSCGCISEKDENLLFLHIKTCESCRIKFEGQKALVGHIEKDFSPNEIPVEKIMSAIDEDLYKREKTAQKLIRFKDELIPYIRVLVPSAIVLILFVFVASNFDTVKITASKVYNKIFNKEKDIVDIIEEDEYSEELGQAVEFNSAGFELAVRLSIDKMEGTIYSKELENIETLEANNLDITDINGIQFCTGIKGLNLSNNKIVDISYLESLKELRFIDLSSNQIVDISALSELDELENVVLYNNYIEDISPLKNHKKIDTLLLYLNRIKDISAIGTIDNLKYLYLSDNEIDNIEVLKNNTELITLGLYSNNIKNLEPLEGMKNLKTLQIENNKISDIKPLGSLLELKTLWAENNEITDISALSNLKKLEVLYIRNNKIKSIEPLRELNNLKELFIAGNPVSDYSPVKSYYDKLNDKKDFELN